MTIRRTRHCNSLVIACLVLAGCGGGGTPVPDPGGEVTAGSMRLTGTMSAPQVFTGSATVYALTGTITKAILNDATPTTEETEIFFQRPGLSTIELMACSPDGSSLRKVCDIPFDSGLIRVSRSANYVYFTSGNSHVYRAPFGGGTPVSLKSGVGNFCLTPSGNKVVYSKLAVSGWWTANADFSGEQLITSDATPLGLGGALNENLAVLFSTVNDTIYALDLTPGTSIVPKLTPGADLLDVYAFEDGDGFGYLWQSGATGYFRTVDVGATSTYSWIEHFEGTSGTALGTLRGYSPDHQRLLIGDATDTKLSTYLRNLNGEVVIQRDVGSFVAAWGPYVTSRAFVGTATWPGAAAVMLCEAGSSTPSVVLADCTTRTSMQVTRVSQPGDSNVVLKLTCDALTKLHYTVGNNYNLRAVVSGNTGLKGAFVSFNAANGQVSTVLTFNAPPSLRRERGHVVVEGPGIVQAVGPRGPIETQRVVL